MTVTITRLYNSHAEARAMVEALRAADVGERNISVLASNADEWHNEKTPATYPDKDPDGKDDRGEAAAAGAGVGAAVGGTVGILTGLGVMAIPGVGPIVAAGWLVAMLAGAAAGGATGSIIGALTQTGATPEEAEVFAEITTSRWRGRQCARGRSGSRAHCGSHGSIVSERHGTWGGLSQSALEQI